MKLKLYPVLCGVLVCCFTAHAQFEGLASYEDPLFQKPVKAQRVRTVAEVESRSTYTFFVGRYTFDTAGRVIEKFRSSGNRVRTEYNKQNLVSKTILYDEKDTSKIASWINMEYDEKGRVTKEETISYQDGKQSVHKREETKVITLPNGKARKETYKGYGAIATDTVFSRDSVSGIYEFTISYEKDRKEEAEDEDEKGRQRAKKTLTKEYHKDNCFYSEEVEYNVYGRLETPEKIRGDYHQTDVKGRVMEYGEIDYEKALSAYLNAHPEDFNMYAMPPMFIRQVLSNKIRGEKKPYIRNIYDSKGLLTEKLFFGTTYKFKYNGKGQVVEQTGVGHSHTTDVLYYNEKGLVSKMIRTYSNPNEDPPKKETAEIALTYTYY